ncbi:DNA mismatch repair protein [Neocucurbitaria cava]|uniref:DNA mismatch repair protein n=1 Tax=Neocucurbitaria cava TaxID=798079 RepID=A0A9W9CJ41_9PLEO|nr:DNA mismatch repair protein [Neocucurbitaria cava]
MTQAQDIATTPTGEGRSILPLPAEVVAQLKSSTAIVSLTGVVLGLLSNSLDAGATKIEATVDFARGGCTVEDDGLGISPVEFREEGALGKPYCTSKFYSHDAFLGRNGSFLAALGAMSLLTITSRHHEHRSQNTITFLHSKTTDRQLPASAQHQLHSKHGTRVTVRNLFGNLPVRVKQRPVVTDQKTELDRLWHELKRHVTCLLLSWRGVASLKIRDSDNKALISFNSSSSVIATQHHDKNITSPHSAQLSSILSLLTQAKYITIDEWTSWVPASASTSALSIKGAISLDPAPSKHVQFISLGLRPLSPESGQNELYDIVNRLFALSTFGTVEEDADVDDKELVRRQTDKRFKRDGYAIRQLKARKDIDRYPMFHLRICLKGDHRTSLSEDQLLADESSLQAVVEVLSAMITQWLSIHHLRPKQAFQRRGLLDKSDSPCRDNKGDKQSTADDRISTRAHVRASRTTPSVTPAPVRPGSAVSATRKKMPPPGTISRESYEGQQHGAFAEWSRIKSANPTFFSNLPTLAKLPVGSTLTAEKPEMLFDFKVGPVPLGAYGASQDAASPSTSASKHCAGNDESDATILWADPSTKRTYTLNARTGCVMLDARSRPNIDSALLPSGARQRELCSSLRLAPKSATALPTETPWLDSMLETWENPIFQPSEKRIQKISLEEHDFEAGTQHISQDRCSHFTYDKASSGASAAGASRLSKQALQKAKVIAQVDKKFILVKMQNAPLSGSHSKEDRELLVLVDQHAADERIKVESLLRDLCTPLTSDNVRSGYQSKLGHKAQVAAIALGKPIQFTISPQEKPIFVTHAARFAAWGILYDTPISPSSTIPPCPTSRKCQPVLSVTSLPPSISARCTSDPQILINLLRSTVWSYAGDAHLPPLPSSLSTASLPSAPSTPDEKEDNTNWLNRLATCPQALIDLINSRACRSAIMFNDELSYEECEALIVRLADCVFPFMCAHGRPSMVPLGDLGGKEDGNGDAVVGLGSGKAVDSEGNGFVRTWKAWREKQT